VIDDPIIFIVDDDPSVRRSLARLLKALGFQTETFASAWEFLAREPSEGPSCLLVDVRMPELSGFDLFERLKAARRDVPVIFITGHGDIPMAVRAIKAGAVDFLAKPFDEEALVSAVQEAIGESRERSGLSRERSGLPRGL
jgi:FixJ family two-component response regulator